MKNIQPSSLTIKELNEFIELIKRTNWSGGDGYIIVTKQPKLLEVGDQYIGNGFAGENIFTWTKINKDFDSNRKAIVVVGKSKDFSWRMSGNNQVFKLPIMEV